MPDLNLLHHYGYAEWEHFITKGEAAVLDAEVRTARKLLPTAFSFDTQCPMSPAVYNFIPFLELLVDKTKAVSDFLGHKVLPTYTYGRMYVNNEVLETHTDRPACEISLTVNLSSDTPWPIYFQTPTGEERSIILDVGDAALYLGCERPHWREPFQGQDCVQVFLHYVLSRGQNGHHVFDKGLNRG